MMASAIALSAPYHPRGASKNDGRDRQELIHRWKPWEQSTGPKTAAGKKRVSRNNYRGAERPMLQALARALREQERALRTPCEQAR